MVKLGERYPREVEEFRRLLAARALGSLDVADFVQWAISRIGGSESASDAVVRLASLERSEYEESAEIIEDVATELNLEILDGVEAARIVLDGYCRDLIDGKVDIREFEIFTRAARRAGYELDEEIREIDFLLGELNEYPHRREYYAKEIMDSVNYFAERFRGASQAGV